MQRDQRIREYLLEEKIGEGGMAEVWRARHVHLDKLVAIKVMSATLRADPQFAERFLQEARAMSRLQHPNIIGATEFFIEQDIPILVMPYVDGGSLEDRLDKQKGPLTPREAIFISKQILKALDHAHQKGIIHRDVKPSNILLDREGHAYLTDFGIALLMGQERKTRTGASIGTPYYMSPEQIMRPKQMDHRSDVYSFGCVFYEMLAGRPPFEAGPDEDGDTDLIVKNAHLQQSVPDLGRIAPQVPDAIEKIVGKALEKEASRRFSGCGEFAQALDALDQDGRPKPVVQRPVAPVQEVQAPAPQPRTLTPPPDFSAAARMAGPSKPAISHTALLVGIGALLVIILIFWGISAQQDKKRAEETMVEERARLEQEARDREERARTEAADQARKDAEEKAAKERARLIQQIQADQQQNVDQPIPSTNQTVSGTSTSGLPGARFVSIRPGTFWMGSNNGDSDEKPVHQVTITDGFYLQTTEVTQKQWKAVMGTSPFNFNGDDLPAENVSWNDVQEFLRKLNGSTGKGYSLPTEAEWEYACRAGTTGDRYGDLDSIAWYDGNSGSKTHPVATKQPNAWGLYDMIGNVWEWCQDLHGEYPNSTVSDPRGPSGGSDRVARGGGWHCDAGGCRSAYRIRNAPGDRGYYLGFRLVLPSRSAP